MMKKSLLNVIKYNKKVQKILDIHIYDYVKYSEIEIEIIPSVKRYGKFINLTDEKEEQYYHIYFNDTKIETKRK